MLFTVGIIRVKRKTRIPRLTAGRVAVLVALLAAISELWGGCGTKCVGIAGDYITHYSRPSHPDPISEQAKRRRVRDDYCAFKGEMGADGGTIFRFVNGIHYSDGDSESSGLRLYVECRRMNAPAIDEVSIRTGDDFGFVPMGMTACLLPKIRENGGFWYFDLSSILPFQSNEFCHASWFYARMRLFGIEKQAFQEVRHPLTGYLMGYLTISYNDIQRSPREKALRAAMGAKAIQLARAIAWDQWGKRG